MWLRFAFSVPLLCDRCKLEPTTGAFVLPNGRMPCCEKCAPEIAREILRPVEKNS